MKTLQNLFVSQLQDAYSAETQLVAALPKMAQAAHEPEDLPYLATTNREFHLTLHRIQGRERFHLALDETGRVMDVTRTAQRTSRTVVR